MAEVQTSPVPAPLALTSSGIRKNGASISLLPHERNSGLTETHAGKQWHAPRSAFRPKASNTTYEKRNAQRVAMEAMKAKEREMKQEKENEKQVCYLLLARL